MIALVQPSPTPHAESAFLPPSRHERAGIALCLSGGGFRAALFHLGALRRLNELDVLSQVTTVAGVSGGSLIAAFLADRLPLWPRWPDAPLSPSDWEGCVAAPFRAFVAKNLGTLPVLWGWASPKTNKGINLLARRCRERLTQLTLQQLPEKPRFIFGATDLISGEVRLFERTSEERWPVATAVAISSCYPMFFPAFRQRAPNRLALVDGGVIDEQSIEPVWRTHRVLLVSDGGDVLQRGWGESFFWSLYRSAMSLSNQLGEVRKRWLISNFIQGTLAGSYWGIDGSTSHYRQGAADVVPGYSTALARDVIAPIRTAYDAFSDAEAAVLENHGYFLANAAISAHLRSLRRVDAPLKPPHPAWLCERAVREALKDSARWLPPRW